MSLSLCYILEETSAHLLLDPFTIIHGRVTTFDKVLFIEGEKC